MIVAIAGLAAGALHVWSGPDHLAAVAPLSLKGQARPWLVGVRWGLGHSAGVAVVGLALSLVRQAVPLDSISAAGEKLVGFMLLGIGAWALWQAFGPRGREHSHSKSPSSGGKSGVPQLAFGVGTLHGLAGSSHFVGVLPALALPSTAAAVTYVLSFALGTVVSMAVFSSALGSLGARTHLRSSTFLKWAYGASSITAFTVGAMWLAA